MRFVQGLKWSQRGRSKGHEYILLKKTPNKQTKKPHKHHQLAFKSSFCEALPVGLSMGAVSCSPAAHHIPRMSQQFPSGLFVWWSTPMGLDCCHVCWSGSVDLKSSYNVKKGCHGMVRPPRERHQS